MQICVSFHGLIDNQKLVLVNQKHLYKSTLWSKSSCTDYGHLNTLPLYHCKVYLHDTVYGD